MLCMPAMSHLAIRDDSGFHMDILERKIGVGSWEDSEWIRTRVYHVYV